jgi:hypothetical protein
MVEFPDQISGIADANLHSIGRANSIRHLIYQEYSRQDGDRRPPILPGSGQWRVRSRTVLARLLIGLLPKANEQVWGVRWRTSPHSICAS